ncbi:unnamed protein product [Polarella glacialis]|uniref:EF-hand domain-containing protein n=1 Tax=Polarella glacialis TaxID=89957 RepID=A0A813JV66_POLGL|nr:unnamed protein product [Polarella glacialis]
MPQLGTQSLPISSFQRVPKLRTQNSTASATGRKAKLRREEAAEDVARRQAEKEKRAAEVKAWQEEVLAKARLDKKAAEAKAKAAHQRQRDAVRQKWSAVFQKCDRSGDGTISQKELEDALGMQHDLVARIFAHMDIDKDNCVDFNEFINWIFENRAEQKLFRSSESLDFEMNAREFLFLLQDPRIEIELDACEDSELAALLQAALSSAVPGEEAQHPQRAEAGSKLMLHALEWFNPSGPQSSLDESIIEHLFFDSMPEVDVVIDSIDQVGQPKLLKEFLSKVSEDRSCIIATFHSTAESNVEAIVKGGLETSCASCSRGLYGLGAYVAMHAGLSHRYSVASHGGRRRMFCVLADTGKVAKGGRDKAHMHTTVDDLLNPEQCCFVEHDRLFVSHLITYHVKGPGIGFSSALREAVERAASQRQIYGVR